jgi:hypothetical protein
MSPLRRGSKVLEHICIAEKGQCGFERSWDYGVFVSLPAGAAAAIADVNDMQKHGELFGVRREVGR